MLGYLTAAMTILLWSVLDRLKRLLPPRAKGAHLAFRRKTPKTLSWE